MEPLLDLGGMQSRGGKEGEDSMCAVAPSKAALRWLCTCRGEEEVWGRLGETEGQS